MVKVLKISGLVLLNLILVFLSVLLYFRYTEEIIRDTISPNGFEIVVAGPIIFIGLLMFFLNKKFKQYGIGLTALIISVIIFSVFFLNKSLASEGDYVMYKLRDNNSRTADGYFINIHFNKWHNPTEVALDKWVQVDSVQVQVNDGFFGMRTMTNNVIILESSNCEHPTLDSADLDYSHFVIANELARQRCFSDAIQHYSSSIKLDPFSPNYFFKRGLVYMVTEDYQNALNDFLQSAVLRRVMLDNKDSEFLKTVELEEYTKRLVEKVKAQNYNNIRQDFEYLGIIYDFAKYQRRISFCVEKLKEE